MIKKILLSMLVFILCGSNVFAAPEDYTTYTEVDPGADIVLTSSSVITYTNLDGASESYVYKDKGAGVIGNFIVKVDTDPLDVTEDWADIAFFGVTDSVDDVSGWSNGFYLWLDVTTGDQFRIELRDSDKTILDSSIRGATHNPRYMTAVRTGTEVSVDIYTDSARTIGNLEDTISGTIGEATAYRYMYALSGDTSEGNGGVYGTFENLDYTATADSSRRRSILAQ